jgi:hypothetical protein
MKLVLSTKELNIIDQVLSVPLMAFGLKELLEKTQLKKEEIEKLHDIIVGELENKKDNQDKDSVLEFSSDELKKLQTIFRESMDIIDPTEMQTITGYEWEEGLELAEKMKVCAGN